MNITPSTTAEIRFSDCDPFGHLNNARFLDYFLHAREQHLKQAYDMDLQTFYKEGLSWVVAGHEIVYLKPAFYGETVNILSSLLKAEDDSLLVEMQMINDKNTHLKSLLWTRFVPVNIKTGKRELHPAAFLDTIKALEHKEVAYEQGLQRRLTSILEQLKIK